MNRPKTNRPGPVQTLLKHGAVEHRPISSLKPNDRNPRTHPKRQIRQIAESIRRFGITNPVLIDDADTIIAGHGRVEAAKLLGFAEVPTIRLKHLSAAERHAYAIADNRLAELAGWDRDLLRVELAYIAELDIDFDLTLTGFETAEIDLLARPAYLDGRNDEFDDCPPLDPSRPAVSRAGDLWALDRHRLLCGDATSAQVFNQLMAGQLAQMVFIDPPYNVPIDGHARGKGLTTHPDFVMAAGEMSAAEYTAFLKAALGQLVEHSRSGSIHFVCMDWRHIAELLIAARDVYSEVKNLCVWAKTNAGMGSLYRSRHELVFVFKSGAAPHINNIELGRLGRYRTNVWTYPGVNSWGQERENALALHPTVKPVALVADAIQDCSRRGGLILDSFAGSGTTILAAERTRRRAYAIELDPHYVDVAILRFQGATGKSAIHTPSGLTFEALRERRHAASPEPDPCSSGDRGQP